MPLTKEQQERKDKLEQVTAETAAAAAEKQRARDELTKKEQARIEGNK